GRGDCVSCNSMRRSRPAADVSGHAPSPALRPAGSNEPFRECQRDSRRFPACYRPALKRAIGTNNEFAGRVSFDANVGRGLRQHAFGAAVDGKTEFLRQAERRCRKCAFKFPGERLRLAAIAPEWLNEYVALAFGFNIRIDQVERGKLRDQAFITLLAHPSDLKVCPAGHIDESIAVPLREIGDARCLACTKPSAMRADTDHQTIAREHWPQRRGTPALDRKGAHDASPRDAAMELRRVTQREASRSLAKQFSIAASAAAFSRRRKALTSSSPSVAS